MRGLAIFLVLMNHVNIRLRIAHIPYTDGVSPQVVTALVWNGQRGVQIFFAVSGFLIAGTSIRRWGSLRAIPIRAFYLLRFARIAPLLMLLLLVLSVLHLAHVQDFVIRSSTGGLPSALFAALTFRINVLEAQRGYLPANWDILWSLSVEEMFYLFFPLVCRLCSRRTWLFELMLSIAVILGPIARVLSRGNDVWYEYSYLGGMDAIALGVFTALIVSKMELPSQMMRRARGIAGAAILMSSLCLSNWAGSLRAAGLEMTILAIGACMMMAASAQTQWQSPRFLQPLTLLGRNSYEVYLTHMFIVFALFHLFSAAGKPLAGVPLLFISVLFCAGLFGFLVARFYSDPCNRLLRSWFTRRLL